ncbi:MAG: RNA methyltransferase, partial [Propionibacteriales bacterium]|nr:RNA methyltransferase [Propionibacteriales bacterium]
MSERQFLVEGPLAVREALAFTDPSGQGCVVEIFATDAAGDRHRDLRAAARAADVSWHGVELDTLGGLTDTVSPQGVVACCRFVDVGLDEVLVRPVRLV